MTSFLDALQDIKDLHRVVDAAKTGGLFGALDAQQKMRERQQLRDLAAAAQESVELQKRQNEAQTRAAQETAVRDSRSNAFDKWNRFNSFDPRVIISVLEELVAAWPGAMQESNKVGNGTVTDNVALWVEWKEAFKGQKDAGWKRLDKLQKELEELESKWFKNTDVQRRMTSLRSESISLKAKLTKVMEDDFDHEWGGPRAGMLRQFPEVCDYFGFGQKEIAARTVYVLHKQFEGVSNNIEAKRRRAEAEGVLGRLDALLKQMRLLVNDNSAAADGFEAARKPDGNPLDAFIQGMAAKMVASRLEAEAAAPVEEADGPMPQPAGEAGSEDTEANEFVVDACMKAMCLVAAVDNTLRDTEVRCIVEAMISRQVNMAVSELRSRVVSTCKKLAAMGYAEAAKALVNDLQPFKGRPLGQLVVELMETVSSADGAIGNRERQVVEFIRKGVGF